MVIRESFKEESECHFYLQGQEGGCSELQAVSFPWCLGRW